MNEIYPVARLGSQILIINSDDLPYIGKERSLEVKCVEVDMRRMAIDEVIELERLLKFNPWEEMGEDERDVVLRELADRFSDEDILKRIVEPLAGSLVKPIR